jgi:5-methylcytosine-specific restriction endonuclease McrA
MALVPFSEKCATQKPPYGATTRARKVDRKSVEATRKAAKKFVRRDDGYRCRFPKCECRALNLRLEVAHVIPLSLGGTDAHANLILLCTEKHRGCPSLHSGDLKITCQTAMGTRGLCDFWVGDSYAGSSEPRR